MSSHNSSKITMEDTLLCDTIIEMSVRSDVSSLLSVSTRDGPPRTIIVPVSPLERKKVFYWSSFTPYAQLCYDPDQATLVAIMETRRKGRRPIVETPESFPSLNPTNTADTISSSSSSSNLSFGDSTVTLSTMTEQHEVMETCSTENSKPFVLGTHIPDNEDENCLYLLHECDDVPGRRGDGIGCARTLSKYVNKTRPFAFLHNHKQHQPIRDRIIPLKHGYKLVV
jgi:hypothetical protein